MKIWSWRVKVAGTLPENNRRKQTHVSMFRTIPSVMWRTMRKVLTNQDVHIRWLCCCGGDHGFVTIFCKRMPSVKWSLLCGSVSLEPAHRKLTRHEYLIQANVLMLRRSVTRRRSISLVCQNSLVWRPPKSYTLFTCAYHQCTWGQERCQCQWG